MPVLPAGQFPMRATMRRSKRWFSSTVRDSSSSRPAASSSEAQVHLDVTRTLLAELGCGGRPIIPVLNKCDLVPSLHDLPMIGNAVRISAKTGRGLDALLESIEENLPVKTTRVELLLPFAQGGLAAKLRKDGTILQEEYTADGLKLTAQVDPVLLHLVQDYVIFPHE